MATGDGSAKVCAKMLRRIQELEAEVARLKSEKTTELVNSVKDGSISMEAVAQSQGIKIV